MENASKALIMAAGILVGLLILALAVYLTLQFGAFTSSHYEQVSENEINTFNSNFLKYVGREDILIHDIVSLATFAKETNNKYDNEDMVQVCIVGNNRIDKNEVKDLKNLIEGNSTKTVNGEEKAQYYKVESYTINEETKMVNRITFKKI